MNTDPNIASNVEDFGLDDEYDAAEDYFPYAPVQQWAALNSDIGSDALGVLTFTMCHLNPHNGKFDAHFGRMTVAKRFKKSLDWVDARYKELVKAGAMTKRRMYYVGPERGPNAVRSPEPYGPETSKRRASATNRWRVRMSPPGRSAYPGPTKIAEYYRPERIEKRVEAAESDGGVAAPQRPPSDQAKQADFEENSSSGGSRSTAARGSRSTAARGSRSTAALKNTKGKNTKGKSGGTAAARLPRTPSADINGGHLETVVTTQPEFSTELQTARAETGVADDGDAMNDDSNSGEWMPPADAVIGGDGAQLEVPSSREVALAAAAEARARGTVRSSARRSVPDSPRRAAQRAGGHSPTGGDFVRQRANQAAKQADGD